MPDSTQGDLFADEEASPERALRRDGPRRIFVDWRRPFLDHAVAHLASNWTGGILDLSSLLVVVPTRHAGRRLREALALHTAGLGAVIPPLVVTPEFFVSPDRLVTLEDPVASPAESLLAWIETLRTVDLQDYRSVFPIDPVERSFTWALHTASQLGELRATLAEAGLTIRDASARFADKDIEPRRWRQLALLEERTFERLTGAGLLDPVTTRIRAAREGILPREVNLLLLLGVADPLPFALDALRRHSISLPVDVFVYAPEERAAAFDEWGRPRTGAWQGHPIALDLERLHRCLTPTAQAEKAATLLSEYEPATAAGTAALCVADSDVSPALRKSLAAAGFSSFEPAGRSLRTHETFFLLETFAQLLSTRSFAAFATLVRCPDYGGAALAHLKKTEGPASSAELLACLDRFQAEHLPHNIDDARHLAPRSLVPLFEQALAHLVAFEKTDNSFAETLLTFLESIYGPRRFRHDHPADDVFFHFAKAANQAIEAIESPASHELGQSLRHTSRLEFLLHLLEKESHYPERAPTDVDLQGWLELFFEDAPHVILTGFNDGAIPAETIVGDPYLPNRAREILGLRDNHHWLARDAYYFTTVLESRRGNGRIDLILGGVATDNTPLRPSRLLFNCPDEELPARANHLFQEDPGTDPDAMGGSTFSLPWRLQPAAPPSPETLTASIRVTAFRSYLACPFRYYLSTGLGMREVENGKMEMNAMDFGTLCHHVLQRFANTEGLRDSTDPAAIREFLTEAANQEVERLYGKNLSVPLIIQLDSAIQRLSRAAEIQAAIRAEGWRIEHAEWPLHEPDFWTIDGVPVRGTIDRIDRHEKTGALRVIDYKTSTHSIAAEDAHLSTFRRGEDPSGRPGFTHCPNSAGKAAAWVDLQLPLYVHAARARFGAGEISAAYFNLPRAVAETGLSLWESLHPPTLDAAMTCARGVIAALHSRTFWPPAASVPYDDFEALFFGDPATAVDAAHVEKLFPIPPAK